MNNSGYAHIKMAEHLDQEDSILVQRCLKGDQQAFAQLLRKYQQGVYNLCFRLISDPEIAQDLAQESFVKVFNALNQYDADFKFSSWLYRIAKNHCYDYLRKKKPAQISLDDDGDSDNRPLQVADQSLRIDQTMERQQRDRVIQQTIAALPLESRAVIVLRHLHDKSYEEMAEILNEPVGTIKARVHRARKKLGELLNIALF